MNVVKTGRGRFVELQGTAEARPFDDGELQGAAGRGRQGHPGAGRPPAEGPGRRRAEEGLTPPSPIPAIGGVHVLHHNNEDNESRRLSYPDMEMIDAIGWVATVVFAVSYFCRKPATLRRTQAAAAGLWLVYGILMNAAPVIVANIIVVTLALASSWREDKLVSATPASTPATEHLAG